MSLYLKRDSRQGYKRQVSWNHISSYWKGWVFFMLLFMLLLSGACQRSSQPTIQSQPQDYALSFLELGTVPGCRVDLSYNCDLEFPADLSFAIGIYDSPSSLPIETVKMNKGDRYQKDLPAGSYRVKVENPANYSFAYIPGEEFELVEGIAQIYAIVVNSNHSTQDSPPVSWELYFSKAGSPAGEKPLAQGEVPALKPGQLYTIHYDFKDNRNPQAGNYMFRLFQPGSESRKNECWSQSIYCPNPIEVTQVAVKLITDPGQAVISQPAAAHPSPVGTQHNRAPVQGTLNIIKIVEGYAPADASYEVIIKGKGGALTQSIKPGQSITLKLDPGVYTVKELNLAGEYLVRQEPEGPITIESNQNTDLSITNIYPVEIPVAPES